MSKLHFIYNGVSSIDLGISIKSMVIDTLPDKRIEKLSLPRFNGTVYEDENIFESYPLDIECVVARGFDITHIRKIKELFKSRTGTLITSRKENNLLEARLVSTINFEKLLTKTSGKFLLSFEIQPFSKLKSGQKSIVITSGQKLINEGNYKSEPIYKITGSNSCVLTVNGVDMKFIDVTKAFVVDVEKEDVYSPDGKENLNKFLDIESDFIGLKEGENSITFKNISKLEVIPNWRELG